MENEIKLPKRMSFKQGYLHFFKGLFKESKLYDLCRKNKVPHVRIEGNICFDLDALNEWWESKIVKPDPEENALNEIFKYKDSKVKNNTKRSKNNIKGLSKII